MYKNMLYKNIPAAKSHCDFLLKFSVWWLCFKVHVTASHVNNFPVAMVTPHNGC